MTDNDDTPAQAILKATIVVLAVLLFHAMLSGCGAARRYEVREEAVTLAYNSDDAGPPPGISEPQVEYERNGHCLMRFDGEYPFAIWYPRGYSGTGCLVKVGSQAVAELLFVEGMEGFSLFSLRWLK